MISYGFYTIGNYKVSNDLVVNEYILCTIYGAGIESVKFNTAPFCKIVNMHLFKTATTGKRILINASDRGGKFYRLYARAILECLSGNARNV